MYKIYKIRDPLVDIQLDPDELLNRLFQNRGIQSTAELDNSLQNLLDPRLLFGVEEAIRILIQALKEQSRIVVIGDFDADGATSTALAVQAFHLFGYKNVDFVIPDRFTQGYGLTPDIAKLVHQMGAELVFTVDNGSSSIEAVDWLKNHSIKVIITDHHSPSDPLPKADAIINPKLTSCGFPSKNLAGVGVCFYVMLALRCALRDLKLLPEPYPNLAQFLDLVALGTISDVVSLDHNNRILVNNGIKLIQSGSCCLGIKMLTQLAKRELHCLQASDLGFAIAPRLNAAGRLENMALGVKLLMAKDCNEAKNLAFELEELNQKRREVETAISITALNICAELSLSDPNELTAIVLYKADWHQGVIGIVASRLKDRFHTPVIVFAKENENSCFIKGSARSIEGLHIRDLFADIAKDHPDVVVRFGGHAMAAGITILETDLEEFKIILHNKLKQLLEPEMRQGVIYVDGKLSPSECNLATANKLRGIAWGKDFPEPLFQGNFKLLLQKILHGKHLKIILEDDLGQMFDAIWFNADLDRFPDFSLKEASLIFKLNISHFQGQEKLELLVEDILEKEYL